MTSNTKCQPKTSPDEAVKNAVQATPGATIGGAAQVAGISVSTAGKVLGRLAENNTLTRHKGGRDGGKRLPDRFTLAGVNLPAAYAKHTTASAAADSRRPAQRASRRARRAAQARNAVSRPTRNAQTERRLLARRHRRSAATGG